MPGIAPRANPGNDGGFGGAEAGSRRGDPLGMKINPKNPSRLWPAGSLATRLGVKSRWLIEEAAAGRIPGVRADHTWLFDPEVVERILLERAREVTSPDPTDEGVEQ